MPLLLQMNVLQRVYFYFYIACAPRGMFCYAPYAPNPPPAYTVARTLYNPQPAVGAIALMLLKLLSLKENSTGFHPGPYFLFS